MCSPQAGRIALGIGTGGLSEAVRPMLGGGNRDLLDNMATLGLGPAFAQQKQKSSEPQAQQQQTSFSNPVFQPMFQTSFSDPYAAKQSGSQNQVIR